MRTKNVGLAVVAAGGALALAPTSAVAASYSTFWNTVVAYNCSNGAYKGSVVNNGEHRKGNYAQDRRYTIADKLGGWFRQGVKYLDGTQQYTVYQGPGSNAHTNTYESSYSDPFIKNVTGSGSDYTNGCYSYNH